MDRRFSRIKAYYDAQDREKHLQGQLPMRSTEVGFWGVSHLEDVQIFFLQKRFPPEMRFLDIGCGDGRVVAVASLYMMAHGVEYDAELAHVGVQALKNLSLRASITCADILDIDIAQYDVIYMYADRNFSYLKEKLLRELKGTLYLYHDTYHPDFLVKQKTTWIGQIPIFAYRAPTLQE